MVRKVSVSVVVAVMLLTAICGGASAATYNPYEGTISTTYLTYAKDILPNLGLNDHYVFLRSGQYEYTMITGDVVYSSGQFSNIDPVTVYTWSTDGGYNSYYSYSVAIVSDITVNPSDKIIYSDLGEFHHLEERGQRYEILGTILLAVFMLSAFIRSIFSACARRR